MPSVRIKKALNNSLYTYYLTFTVKRWYYVLDRYGRWDVLAASLKYFQKKEDFRLYGFVFMINHIHLLVRYSDPISFIRDFKRYTSKVIHENIIKTEPNVEKLFLDDDSGKFEFWEKTNMPKVIENEDLFYQKLQYINQNPVKRKYVTLDRNWYWSSANPDCELRPSKTWE